jgi:biotin carboxylase
MDVVLATDACLHLDDPWGDHAVPVRFQNPDAYIEAIQRSGKRIDGVVAVGDRPSLFAAAAAERLSLPYHRVAAVVACRSKYLTRECFRAAGLRVPDYQRFSLTDDVKLASRDVRYPCVLKPLGLSASQGVIRADTPDQFVHAFERIRSILEMRDIARLKDELDRYVQVEHYIPGREFAIEGIVTQGELQVFAIFDKADPLDGPYFAETIYVTPSREPDRIRRDLVSAATRAVQALGLTNGPTHIEVRYNDQGAWALEAAARPIGGLCARALRFAGGMPLEEVILRHAVGEDVCRVHCESQASGVYMIPVPRSGIYRDTAGVDRARGVRDVEEVVITAKDGQRVLTLPEGNTYLGFIFSRASTPERVEMALREAHAELAFDIAGTLPVVTR